MRNVFHKQLASLVFILYSSSFISLSHADDAQKPSISQSPPTVFELFTSQGCSSCPAADAHLGEISLKPDTITIACHVTYWNYLGWKDTFSKSFCDKRQRVYNNYLKTNTNYTPQIIVNGRYQGVGSRPQKVINMLYRVAKDEPMKKIAIQRNSDSLSIDISQLEDKRTMELVIMGLLEPQTVAIGRGENSGRKITYHNPVRHGVFKELESNTPDTISQDIAKHSDVKHWVVLAQDIRTGAILAAGQVNTI